MVALYSNKVYELSIDTQTNHIETNLSYLNVKEKELLYYLLKNKLYNFTPIEVSKDILTTNRTIINRCRTLVKYGFVIPQIVNTRIRSYQISEDTKINEKGILKLLK